ncbi:hypothetical protein GEMRC1_006943 [Eukaryota sp. GEM-RC1]
MQLEFFFASIIIPVCTPLIDSISSPRPLGGRVEIEGEHFAVFNLEILIESIQFSELISPDSDSRISFDIFPYFGCHNLSLMYENTQVSSGLLCYDKPEVTGFEPESFAFAGILSIFGYNFGLIKLEISFLYGNISYSVLDQYDNLMVLQVYQICTSSPHVEFAVVAGNQQSTWQSLSLSFPTLSIFPNYVAGINGRFYVQYPLLTQLSRLHCLPDFSVSAPDFLNVSSVGSDIFDIFVPYVSLNNNNNFVFTVSFLQHSELSRTFSLPIADVIAQPINYICFTNFICTLNLSPSEAHLNLSLYLVHSDEVTIVQHQVISSYNISLSFIPNSTNHIPLFYLIHQSLNIQLSVSNAPFIIQISEISPKYFQYFDNPTFLELQVFGQHFDMFSEDQCVIVELSVHSTYLNLKVSVSKIGCYLLVISSSLVHTFSEFSFDVGNYLSFLVIVPSFSKFSVLLTHKIENLILTIGSLSKPLKQELHIFSVQNSCSIILQNNLNSAHLDVEIVDFSFNIPVVIGANFKFSTTLDLSLWSNRDSLQLWAPDYDLELTTVENYIHFEFFSSEPGIKNLSLEISFQDVKWIKSESFVIREDPIIKLNSSNLINLAHPSINVVSLLTTVLPENSTFTLNHSISLSYSVAETTAYVTIPDDIYPTIPLSYDIFWEHRAHNKILIDSLTLCYCYVTSSSSLSVIDSRMIEINLNCRLPNVEFTCSIVGKLFSAKVIHLSADRSTVVCLNAISPIYQSSIEVSLVANDSVNFITTDVRVESQFADICFVDGFGSSIPLIPFAFVDLHELDRFSSLKIQERSSTILSSGVRCCDDYDCFVRVDPHDTLVVQLPSISDIWSLSVSFLSDCHDTQSTPPFSISISPDLIESVTCSPFPSGFSTASKCQIYFFQNSILTSSIKLSFPTRINLTEIEVYGFPLTQCAQLLNSTVGLNSVNELLPIDAAFFYNQKLYSSFDILLNTIANSIVRPEPRHSLKFDLFSVDCFESYLSVDFNYYSGSPEYIYCDDLVSELKLVHLVTCQCRDERGFLTSCSRLTQDDVIIQLTPIYPYTLSNIFFYFSSCSDSKCVLKIENELFQPTAAILTTTLTHTNFSSSFNLSLVQPRNTLFVGSILSSTRCQYLLEHKSCLRVHVSLELVQVLPLTNQSRRLSTRDVDISSDPQMQFIIVDDYELDLYLYPSSTSNYVTFQSQSQSVSVDIPPVSCFYPFVLHESQCFCPAGFYFNLGDCLPCPTGTFKSLNHDSCLPCPPNRVTYSNSSTSSNNCVCDRHLYQIHDTCVNCPKNTVCRYGSIIKVRDGLMFDTSKHITISCPLKYLCKNNSCFSSGFTTIDDFCLSCKPGYTKRFSSCLETSVGNYMNSIVINLFFMLFILLFLQYMSHLNILNQFIASKFRQPRRNFKFSKDPVEVMFHQQLLKPVFCPLIVLMAICLTLFNSVVLPFDLFYSYLLYFFPPNIYTQYIYIVMHWLFITTIIVLIIVRGRNWNQLKFNWNGVWSTVDSFVFYPINFYSFMLTILILQHYVLTNSFSMQFLLCLTLWLLVFSLCIYRAFRQVYPYNNFSFVSVTLVICFEICLDSTLFHICITILFLLCFCITHRFSKIASAFVCVFYCSRMAIIHSQ